MNLLPLVRFEDNQSCIKLLSDERTSQLRTKHIDIKYHFVKDLLKAGCVTLEYCPTDLNIADIFTKPLLNIKIKKFSKEIGLE